MGLTPHEIPGELRLAIGITGNRGKLDPEIFLNLPGVLEAIPVSKPFKLVSRDTKLENSVIRVNGEAIGGPELAIIAGPCSVEGRSQILEIAFMLKELGVKFLRGGAYKPRTSPYAFQGLKAEALEYLAEVREQTGLRIVTEVKDIETLPATAQAADILQVGARNMQNYSLLEALGAGKAGALEARALGHHRGASHGGGIHPDRRQLQRDPVRAQAFAPLRRPPATRWTSTPSPLSRNFRTFR